MKRSEKLGGTGMCVTLADFVNNEILPTLGDYVQDFDVVAIAQEVSEYDGHEFVWKMEFKEPERYNEVLQHHDMTKN